MVVLSPASSVTYGYTENIERGLAVLWLCAEVSGTGQGP